MLQVQPDGFHKNSFVVMGHTTDSIWLVHPHLPEVRGDSIELDPINIQSSSTKLGQNLKLSNGAEDSAYEGHFC